MNEVLVVIVCGGEVCKLGDLPLVCMPPSISEKADRESLVTHFCTVVWGRRLHECHFINVLTFKTSQLFCWPALLMRPLAGFQEVSLLPVTPCCGAYTPVLLFSLSHNLSGCV